ncbi:MAG: HEAT repeat domain-containing protein, partial [Spirochaetia bacterium]|nr:HEAT repeat domain-containing protein [Spirochaetia bacterium]
ISLARALLAENPIRNVMQAQLLSTGLSESEKGKSFSSASGNFFEEEWIASLDSPSSRLRTEALLSLSRHGRPSEKLAARLASLAGDPNQGLQIQAIYAIGSLQLRSLIPVLARLGRHALQNREAHLLPAVLTALGRMDDRSALPFVKEVLHQKKWIFPWPFAAEALGKLGRENDLPLLLSVYQAGQIFRKRPLETKMALIAMSRLLEKNAPLFLLFDREEKEPGTALGQLLGDLSGRAVPGREKDAWLEKSLLLFETHRHPTLVRQIEKSLPSEKGMRPALELSMRFLSGRIKEGKSSRRVADAETLAFLWLCAGKASRS